MEHDERYQVRNADIERALRTLAALIEEQVPDGWAFGLFLVPFGVNQAAPKGAGAVFWISNADRAGMIDAVRGWIEDNEKRGVKLPEPMQRDADTWLFTDRDDQVWRLTPTGDRGMPLRISLERRR